MCSGLPGTERGAIDRLYGRTPCPFLHSTSSIQSRFGLIMTFLTRRGTGDRAIEIRGNNLMP